jgi:hypothetical protein
MMRSKVILVALCAVQVLSSTLCLGAQSREIVCKRALAPVIIDGKLDDAAWRDADVITFVVPVTHKKPLSKTEARVAWDNDYLYVSYRAYDKDIWSVFTERDSATFQEDCLELFVQPNPTRQTYYNFEINALGTIYDARNVGRDSGGFDHHRWALWNCDGLAVGIAIEGTINNWQDTDRCWQMEMAVPFAEVHSLGGGSPKAGDIWRVLLARYDYSVHLPDGAELSTCAPLTKVDFHNSKEWSLLRFSDN